jgi:hypothetical protein
MPRDMPFESIKKVLKGTKMFITQDKNRDVVDVDGNTTVPVTKHY